MNCGRLRFQYEYDFGDSWWHEVLFEGCLRAERGQRYPVCLEGARACPPEDVGGTWGYVEFLEAITDPEHEDHDRLLEWAGGSFDPEAFDPAAATRAMRKGLLDWRSERGCKARRIIMRLSGPPATHDPAGGGYADRQA